MTKRKQLDQNGSAPRPSKRMRMGRNQNEREEVVSIRQPEIKGCSECGIT